MLSILKSRSKKKRSILNKQSVGKKSKSDSTDKFFQWSVAAKALLFTALVVLLWGVGIRLFDKFEQTVSYLNSLIVLSPTEWKIEVVNVAGQQLPDDVKREVYKIASKTLRKGTPAELSYLASQVESLGMLDSVKVIRPLADTLVLSANVRMPTLLVSVGSKTRFLTVDGTIFGDASDNTGNLSPNVPQVIVTGIFDNKATPGIDASQRIVVSVEESNHIKEAIEIWQRSVESGYEAKTVNFQKFKGFSVVLADETEIVLGLRPFEYKFKKLQGILEGLKRDGVIASRIELNYEGKAFIKEKKM